MRIFKFFFYELCNAITSILLLHVYKKPELLYKTVAFSQELSCSYRSHVQPTMAVYMLQELGWLPVKLKL